MAIVTVILAGSGNTDTAAEPARILSLRDYGPTEVLYSSDVQSVDWSVDDSYIDFVKSVGSSVNNPGKPVNHALLEVGKDSIKNYHTKFIVAAEFNASDSAGVSILNAMYSSSAFHAAPISLNLMTNAVISSKDSSKSVTVINHPLKSREVRL